jgi:hypothetical protein
VLDLAALPEHDRRPACETALRVGAQTDLAQVLQSVAHGLAQGLAESSFGALNQISNNLVAGNE